MQIMQNIAANLTLLVYHPSDVDPTTPWSPLDSHVESLTSVLHAPGAIQSQSIDFIWVQTFKSQTQINIDFCDFGAIHE
ncbi:hypothetical protein COLO4_06223 [Corchorus olitorius]|uniref:Uncharacterized protein n=1 Tax=Corchorus olitorius TaxID=93759 RepID=A0A1R3KNN0_9ROSI|nr:hypothetical protein COLO4_06223 [Corchorus olitorius]